MDNIEAVEQELNEQELQMELIEDEELQRELEDSSQRMIQQQLLQQEANPEGEVQTVKPVKNPVSSYMMFVSSWKQNHPEEKFNMVTMGQLWKNMDLAEREPYQTEFKQKKQQYEEYLAALQLKNPNAATKQTTLKSAFPLQRIRAIMRQDAHYAPKTESYVAMSKATESFADFMLEEVKRMSQGKSRIDHTLLYDCINNTRSLSFLECLIEEHNRENGESKFKKSKPEVQLEMEPKQRSFHKNPERQGKVVVKKQVQPKLGVGQTSLDFFVSKQR